MMMRSLCHTANKLFSRPRGRNCRGDDAGAGAGALPHANRYNARTCVVERSVTLRRAQTALRGPVPRVRDMVSSPVSGALHATCARDPRPSWRDGRGGATSAHMRRPHRCAPRRMHDAQSHHDDDQRTKDVTTRDLHDTPRTARPRVRHLDMRLCQRPRSPSLTPQTGQEPGNGLLEHPFTRLTRPRPSTSVS